MSLNDRIHEAAHACLYAHANGEAATFTGDDLLALANPPEIGVVQLCG